MKSLTRRALIFLTGFLASRRAVSLEAPWTRLRRVVTSRDRQGRTVVIADGEPTNVVYFGGTRVTRLWESAGLPAELPLRADADGNYTAEVPPEWRTEKSATPAFIEALSPSGRGASYPAPDAQEPLLRLPLR